MKLLSTAFDNNGIIPKKYGYKHGNFSPPLTFEDIPKNTISLALIMDDPDAKAAVGKEWTHWLVWNIYPNTNQFLENSLPKNIILGTTDFEMIGYGGPAPPDKEHTYIFRLFALSTLLDLKQGSTKSELEKSFKNSIIEVSELRGRYSPQ